MSTWFVVGVPHYSGAGGRTFPFYTAPICGRRGQGPGGLLSGIQPHFSHGEGIFGSETSFLEPAEATLMSYAELKDVVNKTNLKKM